MLLLFGVLQEPNYSAVPYMQSWLLFGLCEPLSACTFKQTLVRHGGREESLLWAVYKKEDMFIIGVLVDQHFILAYAKAS